MKFINMFLSVVLLYVNIYSQEQWSASRKPVYGSYVKLPSEENSWINQNKSYRFLNYDNMVITVGPSIRVLPSSIAQQDEVILVRHPVNQNIMLGGANTSVTGVWGQGGFWTTDGGVTWDGKNLLPPFSTTASDPAPTIDKNGVFIFTAIDAPGNPGLHCSYSTNNGASWSSKITITSSSSDKNFAASDDAPSSAFYGRSYVVWTNLNAGTPFINVSYTTNSGISWSSPIAINTSVSGHYSQGCDIMCSTTGTIYACWCAPVASTPFTEDFCGFASSTNGGVNWSVTDNIFDMNGIHGTTFNGWNFRVNSNPRISIDRSGGVRNGWIYIATSDWNIAPAGSDADIIVHRSSDGGVTWSAGIRVNQDALNNGKVQFFPAIRVDEQGGVNVCYYDNRNYPSVGDSAQTYMSRSTDGGVTWTDILVSDHAWKVKGEAGLGNYGGDYIGITSGNGKIFPFWFDDKTGTMQAWIAAVTPEVVGIQGNNNEIPSSFELKQNYPNPFNPQTTISFDIPEANSVKLEVFDMSGRSAGVLVNSDLKAGTYKFDFNAGELASGIYFYKLTAGRFVSTKKMILVK